MTIAFNIKRFSSFKSSDDFLSLLLILLLSLLPLLLVKVPQFIYERKKDISDTQRTLESSKKTDNCNKNKNQRLVNTADVTTHTGNQHIHLHTTNVKNIENEAYVQNPLCLILLNIQ
uniref:Uncharacterized protein n=1 Tax=Glossina palpalis gambiensis TaxID=67801 RepID=A0A1B0APK1_9MUSC